MRFLVFEGIVVTKKYYVEASSRSTVFGALKKQKDGGDDGIFVDATVVGRDVNLVDEKGKILEEYGSCEVDS